MPDTGLIAGDAGADVIGPVLLRLARHFGIADHRPRHAAHVGGAVCDQCLGLLRLVDAPGDEDRDGQRRLDPPCLGTQIGRRIGHRRHDMDRAGLRGRGPDRHIYEIQQRFEMAAGGKRLGCVKAGIVAFIRADPQADDEIPVRRGTDRPQYLDRKAQAVLQRPAIGIAAQVDGGVEELRGQIAVAGDEFRPVQPRVAHPPRGRGIARHDLVDHRLIQRAGHDVKAFVRHAGGRISHRQQAVGGLHDLPPRMEQLREDGAALGMAGLGQGAVAGDAIVVGRHQHMGAVARRLMHPRHLGDDQPDAALGPRAMIGDQLVIHLGLGRQGGVVAGGQDAVAQRQPAQVQGRKEVGETVGHALVSSSVHATATTASLGHGIPFVTRVSRIIMLISKKSIKILLCAKR